MKPKLLVLNGPLGIGKSTLAKRYADAHPVTLNLDVDDVWSMLSHWREEKDVTGPLSKSIAIEMALVTLRAGHDVVIPQILQTTELADRLQQLATDNGADYYEILLFAEKDEAIRRFMQRSIDAGHPSGFREGGIIATSGREKKLADMYDAMIEVSDARPHVIRISPELDDIERTYTKLLQKITT